MNKIDVGIINYNGGESLLRCVSSLIAQTETVRIFVFDNNSKDNSIKHLKETNWNVQITESKKNSGYAFACNSLLKNMTAELQVLCNMDLEFDENFAENLLKNSRLFPNASAFASLVIEKSGKVNALGVRFNKELFAENEASGKDISEVSLQTKEVFGCYGAVMAFRKEAIKKVGFLDASFFLFFEETEWFFRFQLAGLKTIFCPNQKVFHERSLTTVRYSPRKLFYSERNRIRTAFRLLPFSEILKLPFYAFRRYLKMSASMPEADGNGKKNSKGLIILTLIKAWINAYLLFPKEFFIRLKYKKRFGNVPQKTMQILKLYPIEK